MTLGGYGAGSDGGAGDFVCGSVVVWMVALVVVQEGLGGSRRFWWWF